MQQESQSPQNDFTFEHYIVAVIDLLGQSNTLRELCSLPSDDGSYKKFLDAARETVGRILQIRSSLKQHFNGFLNDKTPAQIALLPVEKQYQYKRLKSVSLTTQQFSDTIVAYSPLRNRFGDVTVLGTYATLAGYAGAILVSLVLGIPIPGGIEVSIAVELDQKDIYGPALLRA